MRDAGDHDIRIIAEQSGLTRQVAELRPDVVPIDAAPLITAQELGFAAGVMIMVGRPDDPGGRDVKADPRCRWNASRPERLCPRHHPAHGHRLSRAPARCLTRESSSRPARQGDQPGTNGEST